MDIIFNIENQEIKRVNEDKTKPPATSGSKNYLKAKFNFLTDDWTGLVKVASFKDEHGQEFCKFLGRGAYAEVFIPASVLRGDYFRLSVYAGDLITTNELIIVLQKGGYRPRNCDQDIFVDIYETMDEKIDNTEYTNDLTEIHNILDTKFDKNDFIDCFDARMVLWVDDVIAEINKL